MLSSNKNPSISSSNENNQSPHQYSKEIVVALVGYAGAGCSTISQKVAASFDKKGYESHSIKLSKLIEKTANLSYNIEDEVPKRRGKLRVIRAQELQNKGDELRKNYGNDAIASLAIKEIQRLRSGSQPGQNKNVFLLDSIKHESEVNALRKVYEGSFRLIAVHCEREEREQRLDPSTMENTKFSGADQSKILEYMDRDERDKKLKHGQRVRDAFYLADFFIDNSKSGAVRLNTDIDRFTDLILGNELLRPSSAEAGMYAAHTAALRSSCLSRQVGAALEANNGNIVSLGTNEVPKFGGGVYEHGGDGDSRCHVWTWTDGNNDSFTGCHNTRSKNILRKKLASWMAEAFSKTIAEDLPIQNSSEVQNIIKDTINSNSNLLSEAPDINDIIEYSRSIHAEMDALFSAARSGTSTLESTLYCTTFPCHNCARHLVTAGVRTVYYIEPYVKSRALDLHGDSITTERCATGSSSQASNPPQQPVTNPPKMQVLPFTGVGPRMYEDYFAKRMPLKNDTTGELQLSPPDTPPAGVRLNELSHIENAYATNADSIQAGSLEIVANDKSG